MFTSFAEQLAFEEKIGLSPDRRPQHVGLAFGAVQANLDEGEVTEEVLYIAREKLLGVVPLVRDQKEA